MKHIKRIVFVALAMLVGVAYIVPEPSAYAEASSSALSIAPKKNYVIEPGKSVDDKLIIRNLDNSTPLHMTLRVIDFSYTDDSGTPKLLLDPNAPQTTWSLKPFTTIPDSVTVEPGETKSLDMNVAIPAGHGAGSYYSAIIYSSGSGEGGNVGLSASGVTLVFVNVPGKVSEDLKIDKLGAYQKTTPSQQAGYIYMSTQEPLNVAYSLVNKGNVVESPVGSITLKNMFGKTYQIDDVNPSGSLALINQERTFITCIKTKKQDVDFSGVKTEANDCVSAGLWPGLYTVTADIFYGQNGNNTQEITKVAYFWYLPWWFIITVLVILLVVSFYSWRIYRKFKTGGFKPTKMKKLSRRK